MIINHGKIGPSLFGYSGANFRGYSLDYQSHQDSLCVHSRSFMSFCLEKFFQNLLNNGLADFHYTYFFISVSLCLCGLVVAVSDNQGCRSFLEKTFFMPETNDPSPPMGIWLESHGFSAQANPALLEFQRFSSSLLTGGISYQDMHRPLSICCGHPPLHRDLLLPSGNWRRDAQRPPKP